MSSTTVVYVDWVGLYSVVKHADINLGFYPGLHIRGSRTGGGSHTDILVTHSLTNLLTYLNAAVYI